MQDFHPQRAFRAAVQGDGLPGGDRLPPGPEVDLHCRGLRPKAGRGTPVGRFSRRDHRLQTSRYIR